MLGGNISVIELNSSPQIIDVEFTKAALKVSLADGRKISTPLEWYPRLRKASPEERAQWEVSPLGLHWPALDEDLSLAGMLEGKASKAPREEKRTQRDAVRSIDDIRSQKLSFAFGNVVTDEDIVSQQTLDQLLHEP